MQRSELADDGTAGEATAQPDERAAETDSGGATRDADPAEETAVGEPIDNESNTPTEPETGTGGEGADKAGSASARPFEPSPRPRQTVPAEAEPPAAPAPDADPAVETTASVASASEPEPATSAVPFKPSPRPRKAPDPEPAQAVTEQAPEAAAGVVPAPGDPAPGDPAPGDPAATSEATGPARALKPSPRPRAAQTAPADGPSAASDDPSTGPVTTEAAAAVTAPVAPDQNAAPDPASPGWAHLAEDDHPAEPATADASVKDPEGSVRARKRWFRRIGVGAATIALMLFIPAFIVRMYGIPSESMETTLHGCAGCDNDRVLVDRTVYRFRDPHPGEIVVFNAGPEIWGNSEEQIPGEANPLVRGLQSVGEMVGIAPPSGPDFVKRVIAVGGQTVSCCDSRNRIVVDGVPVDEPYVYFSLTSGPAKQAPFPKIRVPDGMMWMMGDNRNASLDSRAPGNGPVPVSALAGKVRMIIYPLSRLGSVDDTNPQQPRQGG